MIATTPAAKPAEAPSRKGLFAAVALLLLVWARLRAVEVST